MRKPDGLGWKEYAGTLELRAETAEGRAAALERETGRLHLRLAAATEACEIYGRTVLAVLAGAEPVPEPSGPEPARFHFERRRRALNERGDRLLGAAMQSRLIPIHYMSRVAGIIGDAITLGQQIAREAAKGGEDVGEAG